MPYDAKIRCLLHHEPRRLRLAALLRADKLDAAAQTVGKAYPA